MTVSNAYNRPDQLSSELRTAVLETAERLGYPGPDPIGRALRRGSSDVVGVVLTEDLAFAFSDPGSTAFLHGVTSAAGTAGTSVQLISAAHGDIARRVQRAAVDAIIVFGGAGRDAAVKAAERRGLPVVVAAGRTVAGVSTVTVDNRKGATSAANHLRELGHEHVAVLAYLTPGGPIQAVPQPQLRGAPFAAHAERVRGFQKVFPEAAVWQSSGNSVADGLAAGDKILESKPSAILATTDVLAIGVLRAAAGRGSTVGRDLAVTGFDDIDEAARSSPPLTTVHQDLHAHGVDAIRLLSEGGRSTFPTHLVIRTSTTGAPS